MLGGCLGRTPAGLDPAFMIVGLIIGIALVILYIFMAQYVFKDANKRRLNAEMWLLIVLIVPIISWIVYFIVRKKSITGTNNLNLKQS